MAALLPNDRLKLSNTIEGLPREKVNLVKDLKELVVCQSISFYLPKVNTDFEKLKYDICMAGRKEMIPILSLMSISSPN
jgi:hypothetical protein